MTDHDLLVRIDERVAKVETDLRGLRLELAERYVTHDSFEPVKRVVYAIILAGVAAVLAGAAMLSKGA